MAEEALRGGISVTGIIPKSFADKVAHLGLTQLHIVDSMHARKTMLFEMSNSFIALPGGYGTLEEVFELLTWAQLGFHHKPCGLLYVNGYFKHLLGFLDHASAAGFIKPEHRNLLCVAATPAELFDQLASFQAPRVDKWITSPSASPAVP